MNAIHAMDEFFAIPSAGMWHSEGWITPYS
jgi:hypothetical protein